MTNKTHAQYYDVIIIGGGAAGFFAAINLAEQRQDLKIAILERGKDLLSKVRISGGGRCNVTHACFDADELIKNYPRGEKELRSPFHRFSTADTVNWFKERGVDIKQEADGRMFPKANTSFVIIDCFLKLTNQLNIKIYTQENVLSLQQENGWNLQTQNRLFNCRHLIIASGSSPNMWQLLKQLGHNIIEPVPSLFTFNIKDERISNLPGVSTLASIVVKDTKLTSTGPLLITHWGMSGPAVLKLSAWGARIFYEKNYKFTIIINWLNDVDTEDALEALKNFKQQNSQKNVSIKSPFDLPKRLWENILLASSIKEGIKWADINKNQLFSLSLQLTKAEFSVTGKSTFKEEFVTAGGIDLKEIDFKTMRSKLFPQLYFAGEVLNIDAVTGGFNFQNAWTGGYIAAQSIANEFN